MHYALFFGITSVTQDETDLSQHFKKALAIFPSVFMQKSRVLLSAFLKVILKITEQEVKIKSNSKDEEGTEDIEI